jgi:histidinol-phosphatase (PHP family)
MEIVLIDYHVHTEMSDAVGEFRDCVKVAQRKRFSDHFHLRKQEYSMSRVKLIEYMEKIRALKSSIDFPVKLGLEADFIPGYERKLAEMAELKNFDYVIGSVHFIDDWAFDDPKRVAEYQKWDINELYHAYFRLVQECAKSKLFDVIGHVDLIKKFGYRSKVDLTSEYTDVVRAVRENDVCVEVNTGGLRAPCVEIYPARKFLELCFEEGVKITLGSDAHRPEDVGRDFDQALKLLKSIGFKEIVRFTDREAELSDI